MVMDAGWATFVLSHWVREEGLFTMGEGIRRMTSAPARILGLKDRGALKPGMRADITIFDAAKVAEGYPYRVTDFPGGAPRLTQKSIGYRGILVNGQFNVIDGELTGNHSGRVLRHVA
jgi:N-acyl-D-amino-acid deacylase